MSFRYTKRVVCGAISLSLRILSTLTLIVAVFFLWKWVTDGYDNPKGYFTKEFWQWLITNSDQYEPVVAALSCLSSCTLNISSWLLKRENKELPLTPYPSEVIDGTLSERKLLLSIIENEWVEPALKEAYQVPANKKSPYLSLSAYDDHNAVLKTRPVENQSKPTMNELTEEELLTLYTKSPSGLLLLGGPGSGKTTVMLTLAKLLIEAARKNVNTPVPVIIPLTTWKKKHGETFEMWIANQIHRHYKRDAKKMLSLLEKRKDLALFLDGLDEVEKGSQEACLDAINTYLRNGQQAACVLSSRITEYEQLNKKVEMSKAIQIQQLNEGQIDTYLKGTKNATVIKNRIREMIIEDKKSESWIKTPLTLHIFRTVYADDAKVDEIDKRSWTKDNLYHRYIIRNMERKQVKAPSVRSKVAPTSPAAFLHHLQQIAQAMTTHDRDILYLDKIQPSWLTSHRYVYYISLMLVFGIFVGLPAVLHDHMITGTIIGIIWGLITCLTGIQPIQSIRFRLSLKELAVMLMVTQICAALGWIIGCLFWGLWGGLLMGLLMGVTGPLWTLATKVINIEQEHRPHKPNQGITNSGRNFIIVLIFPIIISLYVMLYKDFLFWEPLFAFSFMLSLKFGGQAFLSHYVLRLGLKFAGILPYPLRDKALSNYLDKMQDLLMLQRVGGGWKFRHQELQEYLAKCPFGKTREEVTKNLPLGSGYTI